MKLDNPKKATAGSLTYSQSHFASTSVHSGQNMTLNNAYSSNVTAGNLLLVFSQISDAGSVEQTPTDTLGNNWIAHPDSPQTSNTGASTITYYCWYAIANASGANTVTCTGTLAGGHTNYYMDGSVIEYTVTGSAPTLDAHGGAAGTANQTVSATTTGTIALVIVGYDLNAGGSGTTTVAGYTNRVDNGGGYSGISDKTTSSAGPQSFTSAGNTGAGDYCNLLMTCFDPGSTLSASGVNTLIFGE